jgi:hypothetical protein
MRIHFYQNQKVSSTVYDMPEIGNSVTMHKHKDGKIHNSLCMRGKCVAYGPDKDWFKVLEPGEIYDYTPEQFEHEITAIEPNTMLINTTLDYTLNQLHESYLGKWHDIGDQKAPYDNYKEFLP